MCHKSTLSQRLNIEQIECFLTKNGDKDWPAKYEKHFLREFKRTTKK